MGDVRGFAAGGRVRRTAALLALIAFGVCAGLVLLEVFLQIGAAVVRSRTAQTATPWSNGVRRVVAIGDSNTYGLYLDHPEQDAYPKIFERMWNGAPGLPPIEVLNLGFPGTNSSAARNIFRQALAQVHPDAVTVMVGGNDWWTETRELQTLDWRGELAIWLWTHSRVYRLLYMLRRAMVTPGVAITQRWGEDTKGGGAVMRVGDAAIDVGFTARDFDKDKGDLFASLAPNLRGMLDDARAAGVAVVLITYPADFDIYGLANPILRDVAREENVRLVDAGKMLRRECPKSPKSPCALFHKDGHPTLIGHTRTAQVLLSALRSDSGSWLSRPASSPPTTAPAGAPPPAAAP